MEDEVKNLIGEIPVRITAYVQDDIFMAAVNASAAAKGCWHQLTADWKTRGEDLSCLKGKKLASKYNLTYGTQKVLLELDNAILSVSLNHLSEWDEVWVTIFSVSEEECKKVEEGLRNQLPAIKPISDKQVSIGYWVQTKNGPTVNYRRLDAPQWDDIAGNYSAFASISLYRLMSFQPVSDGGRLILWNGPPGTGKTFALRALIQSWKSWCTAHYIVDPERLFGTDSDYLFHVLMDNNNLDSKPWRLLILEDTGELLSKDARERSGQGLARLLNTADGLLGQGLKTMILITTNEEATKLHPAVARNGRCASHVEFGMFPPAEAARWLQDHGKPPSITRGMSLADLYATLEDKIIVPQEEKVVGFHR